MQTEYGRESFPLKEWRMEDGQCPPFLQVTSDVPHHLNFTCSNELPARVLVYIESKMALIAELK
jgi:hypothetical protein